MIVMRLAGVLHVQMSPKADIIYSRGKFKSVAPSCQMISTFDDERDPEYVPPSTHTPTLATRATRGTQEGGFRHSLYLLI